MRVDRTPRFQGEYCWRTWFIDECEDQGLFGMAERHLVWLRSKCRVGVMVYFEDAPYHKRVDTMHHRLRGPYEVVVASMPPDGVPEVRILDLVVVYRDPLPQRGPWLDRIVKRRIGTDMVEFKQDARRFEWFPYRFGIRPRPDCREVVVDHGVQCSAFCKHWKQGVRQRAA